MGQDLMPVKKDPRDFRQRAAKPPNPRGRFQYVITLTISFENQNFESVSTSMVVLSKSPETFPAVEDTQSYTNYTKCIDVALGNLIGSQAVVIDHLPK